jgi:hypothetical protein
MKIKYIQCDHCHHVYSIEDALHIGGIAHVGTKISTEIGCPKCSEQNGVVVANSRDRRLSTPRYLGSVVDGIQYNA